MSHLRISPDPEHLNASLATYLVAELEQVLKQGIKALTLALSGGRTPQGLLAQLVEKHSNSTLWKELKIIWVDERHVPFDDPDSNYGNALPFIDALGVPRDHIYPMGTNPDTVLAAREYHEFLLRLASQRPAGAALFDITLLGLGADGHTASLFPGTDHTRDTDLCKAAKQPELGQARISFTLPALNSTDRCLFMVSGAKKAEIVSRVYQAAPDPHLPATLIAPRNKPIWFMDKAAANLLK